MDAEMELNELIQKCIRRDERALHDLYKYCFQTMMRVTRRYSAGNDDAVDLTNQSFLKVANNLSGYKQEENFEGWIKRITVNTCIDEYRKNKRYRNHVVRSEEQNESELEMSGRVDNEALQRLNAEEIFKLIDALPDTMREVFNLFAIDGYNHKEIAETFKITEATSRWYLHKARTALQEKINKIDNLNKIIL